MNKKNFEKDLSLQIKIKRKSNIIIVDENNIPEKITNMDNFLKGLECFNSHILYDVYHGKK
jgi:hypothetical protein